MHCPCCNNYSLTDHSNREDDKVITFTALNAVGSGGVVAVAVVVAQLLCGTQ